MEQGRVHWVIPGIEPILELGERFRVSARDTVYRQGDPSTTIFFVESGTIKLSYIDPTGKRISLAPRGPGDMFGELSLIGERHRNHYAEALDEGLVIQIHREHFLGFVRNQPELLLQLLEVLGQRIRELEGLVQDLAFRDIEGRLSRQLLLLSSEYGIKTKNGILIGFRLTHRDLAEMIGSARENTTMALNRLARQGLLDKRRYQIVIKDLDGLREKCGPDRF
ncbi:MAG: Crp/Fnr family transcriptional regulator [Candidatus Bipolaricaulota bacterium]|nr:Crp/Fnr family transcriptional regulator [Candidatus Bipolaricaulota bacterium]MDW8127241.1 Crp/Fnr family transcriptional regulator [Candidatus Bipolaricaulota bacterium]